jgi:hypothetical protein
MEERADAILLPYVLVGLCPDLVRRVLEDGKTTVHQSHSGPARGAETHVHMWAAGKVDAQRTIATKFIILLSQ